MIKNWMIIAYLASLVYCIWRLSKRYKKSSLDGITGYQPGLDLLAVLVLGPVLAVGDIIVNSYRYLKKKK